MVTKMVFRYLGITLSLVVFYFSQAYGKTCHENHAALDFGSGTTKAVVARVDICKKKILETLYEERIALALNEAMEKSATQEIPFSVVEKELPKLQSMIAKVKNDFHAQKIKAVATSVFRVAKNGSAIAKKMGQVLQIDIKIISQEKEAELGFWSVLAQKQHISLDSLIVWDIGGGSMQMYSQEAQGKVHIFEGHLAAVNFKNIILETLQFKDPLKQSSPNPIGNQRQGAIQLAKNHAYLNVPAFFKKNAPKKQWIGVGGVLSMSVQKQVNAKSSRWTQQELGDTLVKNSKLQDAEIKSEYRITEVSNLALVLGYMQALGIESIETIPASLGQGLLYHSLEH